MTELPFPDPADRGVTLDAAIDEYLHVISRTRPWSRAAEEELLNDWSDWAFARYGKDVPLDDDLGLALAYALEHGLDAAERAELIRVAGAVLTAAKRARPSL